MLGFIEIPSVGVIEFEGYVRVDDTSEMMHRRTTVSLDRAWFKDTGLSVPKSEHGWIVESIYDELSDAMRIGAIKSVEDCDDMRENIELYLEGKG